jgi:hypothetical protein
LLKRHQRLHASDVEADEEPASPRKRPRLGEHETDSGHDAAALQVVAPELAAPIDNTIPLELDWNSWPNGSQLPWIDNPDSYLEEDFPWSAFLDADLVSPLDISNVLRDNGRPESPRPADAQDSALPSAAPSPPNETSNEDRTPFAWNPTSKRISEVKEVALDPSDPLLHESHDKFALESAVYESLKAALGQDIIVRGAVVARAIRSLPQLRTLNVFLARFGHAFLQQSPVLHLPTFDINRDCPHYLLTIMIAIGATYCQRKNARRFAIVLQDFARCHLSLAIAADDALLKDPMTIYAAALICYTGLWNGNKRAFELAEALRGILIAWTRRLPADTGADGPDAELGYTRVWRHWALGESRKRLRWFVYMLDCQYASLMGSTPSMYAFPLLQASWILGGYSMLTCDLVI